MKRSLDFLLVGVIAAGGGVLVRAVGFGLIVTCVIGIMRALIGGCFFSVWPVPSACACWASLVVATLGRR